MSMLMRPCTAATRPHHSSASDASLTLAHLSIKPSSRLRSPLVFDGPLFYHFSVISKLLASKQCGESIFLAASRCTREQTLVNMRQTNQSLCSNIPQSISCTGHWSSGALDRSAKLCSQVPVRRSALGRVARNNKKVCVQMNQIHGHRAGPSYTTLSLILLPCSGLQLTHLIMISD